MVVNLDIVKSKCSTEWGYFSCCGYGDIINSFEYEVLASVDIGCYQGDSLLLFKKGSEYGFLSFGWGSCSVCDALEGCDTVDEVIDLAIQLHDSILWFDKEKMIDYLSNKDWELEWYSDGAKVREFIEQCLAILARIEEE